MTNQSVSELYHDHVRELERRAEYGDDFAVKSLACLALVCEGWRYGDPDPEDPGDGPGGGERIIEFSKYVPRLAA